jgi:hypothetical protein
MIQESLAFKPGDFATKSTGDIKTRDYYETPLGKWVRIDMYDQDHNTGGSSVWYKVLQHFEDVTFRDLVTSDQYRNTIITGKRFLLEGKAPGINDPFFDLTDPLRVNIGERQFNGGTTTIRLGTSLGNLYGNRHSFSGMGISHKEADWCYDTE